MALDQIWQIAVDIDILGVLTTNVFFYQSPAGNNPSATAVGNTFKTQVLTPWKGILTTDATIVQTRTHNILATLSELTQPVTFAGTLTTGELLPQFNAVGVKLGVGTTLTRPGAKRLAGLKEVAQNDGVLVDATYLTNLNGLLNAFLGTLNDPVTSAIIAAPIVVKRILDGGVYRLPANFGETVANPIVSAVADLIVTSQSSRKLEG